MVEFEQEEDEGACYAFQLDSHHLVFVVGQDFYASAKFPNPDSSLLDIAAEDGIVLPSFVEKNGHRLKPTRRISASQKSRMRIPNHLEIVERDLNQIEQILSSGPKGAHLGV